MKRARIAGRALAAASSTAANHEPTNAHAQIALPRPGTGTLAALSGAR